MDDEVADSGTNANPKIYFYWPNIMKAGCFEISGFLFHEFGQELWSMIKWKEPKSPRKSLPIGDL